jgi:hypothetical protein
LRNRGFERLRNRGIEDLITRFPLTFFIENQSKYQEGIMVSNPQLLKSSIPQPFKSSIPQPSQPSQLFKSSITQFLTIFTGKHKSAGQQLIFSTKIGQQPSAGQLALSAVNVYDPG